MSTRVQFWVAHAFSKISKMATVLLLMMSTSQRPIVKPASSKAAANSCSSDHCGSLFASSCEEIKYCFFYVTFHKVLVKPLAEQSKCNVNRISCLPIMFLDCERKTKTSKEPHRHRKWHKNDQEHSTQEPNLGPSCEVTVQLFPGGASLQSA